MSAEEAVVVAARLYPGLTVGELARRAGVTEADVRRAWRAGRLVRVELAGLRYYLPEAAGTLPPGTAQ